MAEDKKRHVSRSLHVYPGDDGMVTVKGRLTPEQGALLLQALTAARERVYKERRRTFDDPPEDVSAETPAMEVGPETSIPLWRGEGLDVGYAIDVLHPRALGDGTPVELPEARARRPQTRRTIASPRAGRTSAR